MNQTSIFVASIGTGPYRESSYRLGESTWTTLFAPVATARLLSLTRARALVLVTGAANAASYAPVARELADAGLHPEPVPIADGRNEEEMVSIFSALQERVPENARVVLDVTFGLRHLPFVYLASLAYLVGLRQVEVALGFSPLVEYLRRVVEAAERAGLAAVPEDTGGVGLHLWFCFAPRIPAARARVLLREILWRAGPQPPAVAVELFPKQDRLAGKGLGNLIKLPLGVHQVTLRPSRFLDATLQPAPAAHALASVRPCDPAAIDALLAARVVSLPINGHEAEKSVPLPPPGMPNGPTPRAVAEALANIAPARAAAQAADRIVAGCGVTRELVRRAHEEHTLTPNAARALLYTVGLVGRENERIEALFADAGVSRKELDRARCGLQAPVGCKKLRERLPELCHGSNCPPAPPGGYATPALFALRQAPNYRRPAPPWTDMTVAFEGQVAGVEGQVSADGVGGSAGECGTEIEQRLARIEAALERLVRDADPPKEK